MDIKPSKMDKVKCCFYEHEEKGNNQLYFMVIIKLKIASQTLCCLNFGPERL